MGNSGNGKKIVSGMFWRFGEKIATHLVSFIVSIVLARILMPEDYGIVAIVNVFIAIAEVCVTGGLGTALIQKKDATSRDFSTIFWCNLALSFGLYAIVFLASPWVADFYGMPLLMPVLRVLGLKLIIAAVNSIQNAYVSRSMDFRKFFFATVIGAVASAVVGITMAGKGFGVWALIAQYLSNAVVGTIVLYMTVKWRPQFIFSVKEAKPLVSYGWKIVATDLIGVTFNQLNSFIIGKRYTSSDVAYYTQGKKIPDLLYIVINETLRAVLFPVMSLSTDVEEIKQIRRKSLKMLEFIIFPLMLGMFAIADRMVLVLLTVKWMHIIPFVRITCLSTLAGVMGTTFIQEVKAVGRSDVTLKMELITKPIFLAVVLVTMQFGVIAIAWSLVINGILAFGFYVFPVRKYIGFDFKIHFSDALPPLMMSAVMCAVVHGLGLVINNNLICLATQIFVGGVIYIGLSVITKNDSFVYLKNLVLPK